jgi:predicted metal-dependent phosphoesterase TrpH
MGKVDLHIHTTASDGRFSPAEIVRKSVERGLTIIAIADHDTVNGIEPALAAAETFPGLELIPAVEISVDVPRGEVHVLGYYIDYTDTGLKAKLEVLRQSRVTRAQGIIARLGDLGIHIDWQRVSELAGDGAIGRPHVAQAMLEKGYISSLKEAFINYIGRGGPAYVEREKLTPAEAVKLILWAQGLPVLAHPFTVDNPEALVIELKEIGLVGIEAYYAEYASDRVSTLVRLADKYSLIATGGSDYHGLDESNEVALGDVDIPPEAVERFLAMAQQRGLRLASS